MFDYKTTFQKQFSPGDAAASKESSKAVQYLTRLASDAHPASVSFAADITSRLETFQEAYKKFQTKLGAVKKPKAAGELAEYTKDVGVLRSVMNEHKDAFIQVLKPIKSFWENRP